MQQYGPIASKGVIPLQGLRLIMKKTSKYFKALTTPLVEERMKKATFECYFSRSSLIHSFGFFSY